MKSSKRCSVLAAALLLVVSGCGKSPDADELTRARTRLHVAPCADAAPAVNGVAGAAPSRCARPRAALRAGEIRRERVRRNNTQQHEQQPSCRWTVHLFLLPASVTRAHPFLLNAVRRLYGRPCIRQKLRTKRQFGRVCVKAGSAR